MLLKQKLTSFKTKILQLPELKTIPLVALFVLLSAAAYTFLQEKQVNFAYNKETCIQHLTMFPRLTQETTQNRVFSIKYKGILKVGNAEIASSSICFVVKNVPKIGSQSLKTAIFGWFGVKTFKVNIPSPPSLRVEALKRPISTVKPLKINLDSLDKVFDYSIEVDNKKAGCPAEDSSIYCDIASLHLSQGKEYGAKIARNFKQQTISTVVTENIQTLSATNVVNTSVPQNGVVYDKPKTFTLDFDKDINNANIMLEKVDEEPLIIASTMEIQDKKVILSIDSDLARDSKYRIFVKQLEATDGSTLLEPYSLNFIVSGGPSVSNISIGTSGVDSNARVVVTLDQPFSRDQDVYQFASFSGGVASISRTDNQIIFQLRNVPICSEFSIKISKGLISRYGIIAQKGWSYYSRINCRRATSVIGYSVLGRPIMAYYYGSGPTTVLFTGGIHGSERSGSYIMSDWVSHLDSYAYKIPAGRQVVVVPQVNPDGLAAISRYNAHDVNLDRNFPSANWRSDIDTTNGVLAGGGGASPLSEPETTALANFTTSLRPRLEVSFHAAGSLIGANQVADSVTIGNLYGSSVGYRSMIGQAEQTMGYSITGEYEDWMGEKYGIPAILIELPTAFGRYFTAHQSVLWRMVSI